MGRKFISFLNHSSWRVNAEISTPCLESPDLHSQVFVSCLGLLSPSNIVRKMKKFLQEIVITYTVESCL